MIGTTRLLRVLAANISKLCRFAAVIAAVLVWRCPAVAVVVVAAGCADVERTVCLTSKGTISDFPANLWGVTCTAQQFSYTLSVLHLGAVAEWGPFRDAVTWCQVNHCVVAQQRRLLRDLCATTCTC